MTSKLAERIGNAVEQIVTNSQGNVPLEVKQAIDEKLAEVREALQKADDGLPCGELHDTCKRLLADLDPKGGE